jgi:hypothetical protein
MHGFVKYFMLSFVDFRCPRQGWRMGLSSSVVVVAWMIAHCH